MAEFHLFRQVADHVPQRNTEGTLNYQSRIHKFSIDFTPEPSATVKSPASPNLQITYVDSILFVGPDGVPCTGLDADIAGFQSFPGFPPLPVANYLGDGFGNAGPGGRRISLDSGNFHLPLYTLEVS